MATEWVAAYQLVSAVLAAGGLWYSLRARDPFEAGLYLGAAVAGAVFEWIFDTRWYFHLTSDPQLVALWRLGPVSAPLAMVFFYAFFFGAPLIALIRHYSLLESRLGTGKLYAVIVVVAAVGVLSFEGFNTSVIKIYTYHQRPEFLLAGMPWSNLWFSPAIFCAAFWGAVRARELLRSSVESRPSTAVVLGAAVMITAYFAASALNGVWYFVAQPWSESGRPF